MEIAQRSFKWLFDLNEASRLEFKCDFRGEAKNCGDLLNQASYHLSRAKRRDDEEQALKRKQELSLQEIKEMREREQQEKEQAEETARLALQEKRAEFVKKTQNLMQVGVVF